jgi:hypothetical protein
VNVLGKCDRCPDTSGSFSMSFFNNDTLCEDCSEQEQKHPDFALANAVETAEVKKGNYNFLGVGWPGHDGGIPQEDKERARKLGKEASALYQQRNNLPEDQHPQRSADLWGFQEGTGSDEWWELHKKAEALQEEQQELEGYFRLNIWGMRKCREAMDQMGMVDWEAKHPEYPDPEDFGLEEHPEEEDEDGNRIDYAEGSSEGKWFAAVSEWRDSIPASGLPAGYKFGSNDGWLVTPTEINNALALLKDWEKEREDRAGVLYVFDDNLPPWFGEWVGFMRRAAQKEGFRVHV